MDRSLTYGVCQLELGTQNKKLHLQGYLHRENPTTRNVVKRGLGPTAHLEPARGSALENRVYCTKDSDRLEGTEPWEWGELPAQGKRSDLDEALAVLAEEGSDGMRTIRERWPRLWLMHGRRFKEFLLDRYDDLERPDGPRRVIYLWGPSGSGKSRWVAENFDRREVYRPTDNGTRYWWDGYRPDVHRVVHFEEFRGTHSFNDILQWTDRYHVEVELKGTKKIPLTSDVIIFTTNLDPKFIHWLPGQRAAFERRCEIIYFQGEVAQKWSEGNTGASDQAADSGMDISDADIDEILGM